MSIAKFPESLSQQILVGIILVGRLFVEHQAILTGTDVGRYSCGSCALREQAHRQVGNALAMLQTTSALRTVLDVLC